MQKGKRPYSKRRELYILEMAYNLRTRRLQNAILYTEEKENIDGEEDSAKEDNVLDELQTDSETLSSAYTEDEDAENTTLNQRILEQRKRARGRPSTTLQSKSGFKWSTKPRLKVSSQYKCLHHFLFSLALTKIFFFFILLRLCKSVVLSQLYILFRSIICFCIPALQTEKF